LEELASVVIRAALKSASCAQETLWKPCSEDSVVRES
jgi:hypothetical protein